MPRGEARVLRLGIEGGDGAVYAARLGLNAASLGLDEPLADAVLSVSSAPPDLHRQRGLTA